MWYLSVGVKSGACVLCVYRLERNRERLLADSTLTRAANLGEFGHVAPSPYLPTPTAKHVSVEQNEWSGVMCGV